MTYPNPTKAFKLDSVLKLEDFGVFLKAPVEGMPDMQKIVCTFISSDGNSTYFMVTNWLTCKIEKDVLFWDTVNKYWFLIAEGGRKIHVAVKRTDGGITHVVDCFQLGSALSLKRIHNNSAVGALPNLDERYPGEPAGITISEVLAKAPELEVGFFNETTNQLETIKSVEDAEPWIKQLENHEDACVLNLLSGNRIVLRSPFLRADPKTDVIFLNCAQANKQTLLAKRADCATPLTASSLRNFLASHKQESKQQQNPEAAPAPSDMSLAEALAVAELVVKVGRVSVRNGHIFDPKVTWNEAISVEPASVQNMPNAYVVNFRDGNFLVTTGHVHIRHDVFPYLKNTVTEDWFPVAFEYRGETVTYAEVQSLIAELKYKSHQPTIQQPAIERNRPFAPSSDWTLANLAIESIRYFQTKHSPEEKTVTAPTTQRKLDEVLAMKNIQLFVDEPNSPHRGERIIRTFIPQPSGKIQYYIVLEKHAIIKLMDFNLNWCDKNNQWSLTDCLGERFAVKALASSVFTEPTQAVEKPDESKSEDKTQGRPAHPEIKLSDIQPEEPSLLKHAEPPLSTNLIEETLKAIELLVVSRKKMMLTSFAPPASLLSVFGDPGLPVSVYSVTKSTTRDKNWGSSVKVQLTFRGENGRFCRAVVTHKVPGENKIILKWTEVGGPEVTRRLSWD